MTYIVEDALERIARIVRLEKGLREQKLRAARRCSDCVHLEGFRKGRQWWLECQRDQWTKNDEPAGQAATCPDYEEAAD